MVGLKCRVVLVVRWTPDTQPSGGRPLKVGKTIVQVVPDPPSAPLPGGMPDTFAGHTVKRPNGHVRECMTNPWSFFCATTRKVPAPG